MIQLFYDNLPDHKKPFAKYASKRMYHWPSVNSYYSVGTAGAKSYGRGGTINNVHFSEVAFAECADKVASALLQAVPMDGNVFEESTANGLGNYFHEEWESSGNGDSVFRRHFTAWFENPEYRVDVPYGFKRTPEEQVRADRYVLDDGQLAWYRIKAKELKEEVKQEYPENAEEAFLASGHPYFDRKNLVAQIERCSPTIDIPKTDRLKKISLTQGLNLYMAPIEGKTYVISADTAEGLTDKGDHDYDSASVWDAETWEQVAHLHGRWDTHEFGLLLAELGFWFNKALLVIERNNHGHAVINAAMHSGNYPPMSPGECSGLYYHEDYDAHTQVKSRKPGWPTTPKTKYFALDGLASSLLNNDIKINSPEMIAEMVRYVKLPGNKSGGESGAHDDRVIDAAIGDVALKLGLWKKSPHTSAIESMKALLAARNNK